MYSKMLSFYFAILLSISTSLMADYGWENYLSLNQCIENIAIFPGDKHGDFQNDPVVLLSDGSAWKIHPKDVKKFARWSVNDVVHIGVRTSFYFFKRQHKFELHNHTIDDSVRVMLVQSAEEPLYIIEAQTYVSGQDIITNTYVDQFGFICTDYYAVNKYERMLILNDGSQWILNKKKLFKHFPIGSKVYIGANADASNFRYFLISGMEREAKWSWAFKL